MSELYNRHSVKHRDSFLFGGRRGYRTQDGGRKGEESTLDVKDFHFPNTSAPSLSALLWPSSLALFPSLSLANNSSLFLPASPNFSYALSLLFPLYLASPFNGPRPGTLGAQEIKREGFIWCVKHVCGC